tara:strand:- start:98 stop:406 length:309 start_codon:yes stop_codon:yes gene_type:complete
MTQDELREAMIKSAKEGKSRISKRDGQTQFLKQNLAPDYNMGGRDSKPQTKQIIKMALQGKDKNYICKCMAFQGYTRTQTLAVLHRHEDKIVRPTSSIIKKC